MRDRLDTFRRHRHIIRANADSSADAYVRYASEFIDWYEAANGSSAFADVERGDIMRYLEHLYMDSGNLSSNTRATKLSALRAFFHYLRSEGVILGDPTEDVPSPKKTQPMPRVFSKRELGRILGQPDLGKPMGIRDHAMLMTIYGAGLRKAEVVNLDVEHVQSEERGYAYLHVFGKGGKERIVGLRRTPAAVLRRWVIERQRLQTPSPALFVRMKGVPARLHPRRIGDILKGYAELVGIRRARAFVHKLRATWATELHDNGVDLLAICAAAGWSDPKTAMRYIRTSQRALKEAMIPDRVWSELSRFGEEDDE